MDEEVKRKIKRNWYFQGFNARPGILSFTTLAHFKESSEILGYGYKHIYELYEGDKCYFLYDWEDLEKNLNIILSKVKQEPSYTVWLLKKDKEMREKHKALLTRMKKINLESLPYKEAHALCIEFQKSYAAAIGISLIVESYTYPTEDIIRKTIADEMQAKDHADKTEEAITLLTGTLQPSFIGQHQLRMLKIAAEIPQSILKAFLKKTPAEVEKEFKDTEFFNKIVKYQQQYFWINNAYAGAIVLPVTYFVNELQEIVKKYPNPKKECEELEKHFATIKQRKDAFIEKYNLSEYLKRLIIINDVMGIIHDARKEIITETNYYIDEFLKRFGKERNLSHELMKSITFMEINEEKTVPLEELENRKKNCVIFYEGNPLQYSIFSSKKAEEIQEELFKDMRKEEEEILHGYCGSQGYAKGKVRICRGLDAIPKLQEGEILVACMTQPEFVPAMKKAAAIVTDEGGLTCHAAIIARELKKPCVVSTKKATHILKDGMIIEVHATEGYVKIIKK